MATATDSATSERGTAFWASGSGKWAGEQLMRAMKSGDMKSFSPATLRTNDVLGKDEWKVFDDTVIGAAAIRLQAVADLFANGQVIPLSNAMAKTVFEYQKMGDMDPATVSLDGMTRSENDRLEFTMAGLPIPITHKDFFINLRVLMASRVRGEGLDVTQSRVAGRLVGEEIERQLIQGGRTFGGLPIYGYLTHPDRNTGTFGAWGAWSGAAVTGDNILSDILGAISALEVDRHWGPYWIYLPRNFSIKFQGDYKASSDKTIMQRIGEVANIKGITVLDQLPPSNVLVVEASIETAAMLDGEAVQTVQWDINGGFGVNFKAFAIQVPVVRSDAKGNSGIFHLS